VGERDGIAGVTGMEASEQSRTPDLPDASNPPRYWFPAKRYGWGWGMPCAWQGWLVLAAYLALMVCIARLRPPEKKVAGFTLAVVVLSAGLVPVCFRRVSLVGGGGGGCG
jgi:hypothetical protein